MKATQVPKAVKPKGQDELTRLQNQGILTKVGWSEWATPIVLVLKENTSVRLKVTVNSKLKAEQ